MKTDTRAIAINTTRLLAAGLLLASALQAAAQDTGKRLYCWNENGQRVCGDTLPVDAIDEARSEFNAKTGAQTDQVARALTDEELDAKLAAEAESVRQAKLQAQHQLQEQAMLASYANESELRHTYQTRIDLLDATIKGSTLTLDSLRKSLLDLLQRAGEQELAGRPVPKTLVEGIDKQHSALLQQQAILTEQYAEQRQLHTDQTLALARYRELKTAPDTTPAQAQTQTEGG